MARNGHLRKGNSDTALPIYPIRTVSKMTGVSEGALRGWEARYGIIEPARTAGGHRLFSENDIDRILEIKRMLHDDGMSMAGIQRVFSVRREAHHG